MKKVVVSVSGGETSAMMAYYLKRDKSHIWEMIFIISNTGLETNKALEFADKCDKYFELNLIWVECITNPNWRQGVKAKVVTYETADMTGQPFEGMIKKHGIPNMNFKHCSRELKERTIRAYLRSIGWKKNMYHIAIGYRMDEPERLSGDMEEKRHIYPFAYEYPITKPAVNRFWRDMPFRLELKGYEDNCGCCWKKSLRNLLTIAKYHPERFDKFKEWEEKYKNFVPEGRKNSNPPTLFFRNNLTVDDILKMSKEPFEEARNNRIDYVDKNKYAQQKLFGIDLDIPGGRCGEESCEAFQ